MSPCYFESPYRCAYRFIIYLIKYIIHLMRTIVYVFSPSASKTKIKDAHKRIMLVNHPDRGTCKPPQNGFQINELRINIYDHGFSYNMLNYWCG